MKYTIRSQYLPVRAVIILLIAGLATVTVFKISSAARTDPAPQDVIRLEGRMNQMEQRLFAIETSIRTLEQQSRLGDISSRGVSPESVTQLRLEIQRLQQRLEGDECGLAKLDERTLNHEMRDARKRSGAGIDDPCRQSVDTPLQLRSGR